MICFTRDGEAEMSTPRAAVAISASPPAPLIRRCTASWRLIRGPQRPKDGFFLCAESFFNGATEIDDPGVIQSYGGRSLYEMSRGESFFTLFLERFRGCGLYLLDELRSGALAGPAARHAGLVARSG